MAKIPVERFTGSLLGLALGDAFGAPLEGGPIERFVWRLIGKTRSGKMRWTDDTQMSLDLAESLISNGCLDCDDAARRFAASYRWSRGYGPSAARLLKKIRRGADWREANQTVFKKGSFENGGAMRSPVVGLFFAGCMKEVAAAARESASITHAHPLGLEGAVFIAVATATASLLGQPHEVFESAAAHCAQPEFLRRAEVADIWLKSDSPLRASDVRSQLGNGIAAAQSCVTAAYIAVRFVHRPFDEMLSFVASCRGDVDTIGAMAGAIWGASRGVSELPADHLNQLEQRDRIEEIAVSLYQRLASSGKS